MNKKIRFLKSIDRIIGKPLTFLLSHWQIRKPNPSFFQDLLIIRPGGIGDAVLLLPSIRELKKVYPHLRIDILCEKRNSGVFELSKGIENIYLYDRDMELFKCLRNQYDVVIDTEQWHRLSAVVALLTGAPVRVGFATNERERFFTHRIPYSHDDYEVYSFFHLIEPLIGYIPEFNHEKPFIDIENSETSFDKYLSENTVAIFPGASVKERKWGGGKYGIFAKELIKRGYNVIIIGSKSDKDDAKEITGIAKGAIDLTGKTSLKVLASILKRCRLLITADSGILHLAVGVETATLSLFGSGIEKKWAPKGKRHRIINRHLPCSPCTKFGYTPRCKLGVRCMTSITVGEVYEMAVKLLNEQTVGSSR